MAPWNVPNTDGFDLRDIKITVYDTTISNGDDNVAIGTTATEPTGEITIRRVGLDFSFTIDLTTFKAKGPDTARL